ncbi:glycosyltransferase [Cryobacterium sp. N21]|uniref:glycosyltransferase family 2 protein n=1 Tax=Cryobacterium sp. N21 TaxID=2048289 RepID=UPI001304AA67|nr:glycosyltransferase [Cryobacterium sp. N21]
MKTHTTTGIIATYNQQDFIREAVVSLAVQVDEIIVVNDASTDGTRAALDELQISNLRVLHNETQCGVSATYNRAVTAATSDLLLIQGGDDRSLPGRAARQIDALNDPDVSLAYSLPTVIDSAGMELPDSLASEFHAGRELIDPLTFLFFHANYICAPAAAVRRADYLRHGGFPGGLDLLQDYALWLRLAADGRFAVIDEPVVEYRKHGKNLSREYSGLDSVKHRRLDAEQEFIRTRFLTSASSATMDRLARYARLDLGRFTALTASEKIALIQLSHRDRLMVRHGVSFLFGIAGEPDSAVRFARLGLTRDDLSRLAVQADHNNLGDVSRALGVQQAINRITAS